MRVGLLQLESGISGDMFLGALVGAGASLELMEEAVRRVSGDLLRLRVEPVLRAGLAGTRVRVLLHGEPIEETGGPENDADPARLRGRGEGRPDAHTGIPPVAHAEVTARLENAALSAEVRETALRIFRLLAETEALLHGVEPGAVHFHELGSWDALADVVAAVAGVRSLGLERLYHGPVALGGGTVAAAHGRLPVPAPVTLRLLEGRPCRFDTGGGELTTPTGAALLAVLAEPAPEGLLIRPGSVGYGAGRADSPGRPNLTRLVVGEKEEGAIHARVAVVEAALDDFTPEEGGHLLHALLEAGALDAALTPTIMKKSRPGFVVRVITAADRGAEFAGLLLRLSTTLGARWRVEERLELPRRVERVRLAEGEVRIKVARLPDGSERLHPEHEDVARVARSRGAPLAEVRREVERVWRETR